MDFEHWLGIAKGMACSGGYDRNGSHDAGHYVEYEIRLADYPDELAYCVAEELQRAFELGQQSRALPVYEADSRVLTPEGISGLAEEWGSCLDAVVATDNGSYITVDGETKPERRKKKRSMADVDCRVPYVAEFAPGIVTRPEWQAHEKELNLSALHRNQTWRDLTGAGAEGYQVNGAGKVRRKESAGE